MGHLDFEHEKEHYKRIKKVLARRGIKIDTSQEWKVHGPHSDMNYHVFVGFAYTAPEPNVKCICSSKNVRKLGCRAHRRYYCVAIYPRVVYEIEDESRWWDVHPGNRILKEKNK